MSSVNAAKGPNAIEARRVSVAYGKFQAIKDVSLDIPHRKIVALIGASGSGKSSFLRSLNRMLDAVAGAKVEGEIRFNGRNILASDTDVIELRKRVGMLFQHPVPFPKSVYDNVAYGLEVAGVKNLRSGGSFKLFQKRFDAEDIAQSRDYIDRKVVKSLTEAGLWDEVKDRLGESALRLSGGQQQRLCLARSIAIRPDVLLLDEPCSSLDPISTRKIEETLIHLKHRYTIVIVTHNMHQARRVSDITALFHLGELVEVGPTPQIFEQPAKPLTQDYVNGSFG